MSSIENRITVDAATPALRRAELARYIGWVFQNTQPLLEAGVPTEKLPIANVDLHAIVSLADRVAFDMRDAAPSNVTSFFSRLQQYLYCVPGLADAILNLQAAWLWFWAGDRSECVALLSTLHTRDLASVKYAPLLEIYLECFSNLPVTRQLNVVERILELHSHDVLPSRANLLHYGLLKGLLAFLLGDGAAMAKAVDEAIKQHLDAVELADDVYSLNVAAMTRQLKWRMYGDPIDLGRAIEILHRLLEIPHLTSSGKQNAHQELGMLLTESGAYPDAIRHLELAGTTPVALVNLADVLSRAGRLDDAAGVLARIDTSGISAGLKLECLAVEASLATARGDLQRVEMLVGVARGLELPDLYFQRTRDHLCIALLEFAQAKRAGSQSKQMRGIVAWIRYLSQFLELKPNVGGVGLNLNRLIEGAESREA